MDNELTFSVVLSDGTFDGAVTVEHGSFAGSVIKISRSQADEEYAKKEEIDDVLKKLKKKSGVYILLGQKADEEESAYIGQSDDVYKRLNQHISDYRKGKKSFYWTTAVVFSKAGMDQTELLYLEHRICQIIKEHDRYACLTTITNKHNLEQREINELENIVLPMIKTMFRALGCDALTPVSIVPKHSITLYLSADNGAEAKGFYRDGKFVIKKGSKISMIVHDNLNVNYAKERTRLQSHQNGTIKDGVFTKDCSFENISIATGVICGKKADGKKSWKTAEGITLKECENLNVK